MKFYSEKLDKVFDEVEQLNEAEEAFDKQEQEKKRLKQERKERAKEVQDALDNYHKLLKKFVDDFGCFHSTFTLDDLNLLDNIFSIFNI